MDISQFDLHAKIEDVHWWFKARREIMIDLLKRYVPIKNNKTIAEIGCGTGGNLKFFQNYYNVIGIDTSPEAIEYARRRIHSPIFLGDFRDVLVDRWNSLDAIVLADILEHIDDDATFLRDIVTRLKVGAILLLTVPAHAFMWSHHDIVLGHKRRYSKKKLQLLWKDLDIEELFFSSFNSALFPAIALYRILKPGGSDPKKSNLALPPSWANYALYKLFAFERILLELIPLPYGVSYIVILKKRL